jgi:CubicO group peptidase (beta-lactamase class C family)
MKYICFLLLPLLYTKVIAQPASRAYTVAVKDSIVARFNRDDFKGIYALADTAFTKVISEKQLADFLRSVRNNGNIVSTKLLQDSADGKHYFRCGFELRNMVMVLKLAANLRFTLFGLYNEPPQLLAVAPRVPSNNPLATPADKTIDSIARDYFRHPAATALSIGILQQGRYRSYHYGATVKNNGVLPNDSTLYEIGSITKTFTATLLAQAVLDRKLSLDDDIRRYLHGQYPNLAYKEQPIRVRDLANHTSRLPSIPANFEQQTPFIPLKPYQHYTNTLFTEALHRFSPDTLPGYKFEYSNMGMALLGHILENVYGQPYEQLLEQYITRPLQMFNTGTTWRPEQFNNRALPYSENGQPVAFSSLGIFISAGAIHSSLQDLFRYAQCQLANCTPAVQLTHQPTVHSMGLGWGVLQHANYSQLEHNGSTEGFRSNMTLYPELHSGCIVLANSKASLDNVVIAVKKLLTENK